MEENISSALLNNLINDDLHDYWIWFWQFVSQFYQGVNFYSLAL